MHILSLDSHTVMPSASRAAYVQIDVVVRLEKHCPQCSLKLCDDLDLKHYHLSGLVITVKKEVCMLPSESTGTSRSIDGTILLSRSDARLPG